MHRLDGPAFKEFYDNGQVRYEVYFINYKRHRLDGPAISRFNNNGQLDYETYYINGRYYTKSEYEAEIFKMKLALL